MQKDEFLDRVREYGEMDNTEQALRMTEVFLSTLGEWLYRTECRKFASQLPKELKGFLYAEEPPEPSRAAVVRAPLDEFYNRIKARAETAFGDAVQGARGVGRTLTESISSDQIEHALSELPDGFRELFAR